MGQTSCVELSQALPAVTGRGSCVEAQSIFTAGKVQMDRGHVPSSPSAPGERSRRASSAFSGQSPFKQSTNPLDRTLEPGEISRLRAELQHKEHALEAMRKDATDHMTLLQALERKSARKELRKCCGSPTSWTSPRRERELGNWETAYVASLVEELNLAAAQGTDLPIGLKAELNAAMAQGAGLPVAPRGAVEGKSSAAASACARPPLEASPRGLAAAALWNSAPPQLGGSGPVQAARSAVPECGGDKTPCECDEAVLSDARTSTKCPEGGDDSASQRDASSSSSGMSRQPGPEDLRAAQLLLRKVFRLSLRESCRRRDEALPVTVWEHFDSVILQRRADVALSHVRETQELASILEARRRVSEGLAPEEDLALSPSRE